MQSTKQTYRSKISSPCNTTLVVVRDRNTAQMTLRTLPANAIFVFVQLFFNTIDLWSAEVRWNFVTVKVAITYFEFCFFIYCRFQLEVWGILAGYKSKTIFDHAYHTGHENFTGFICLLRMVYNQLQNLSRYNFSFDNISPLAIVLL